MNAQPAFRRSLAAACVLSLALLSACGDLLAPSTGRLALTVKWPGQGQKSAFTILAIPETTTRIEITIRGEGIPDAAPLKAVLTPDGKENATEFIDVPIGPKYVEALALDAAGKAVAIAGVAIAVQPNALIEQRLVLQAIPDDPFPTPSATPSALPTPPPTPGPSSEPTPVPSATPSAAQPLLIETVAGDGVQGASDNRDPLVARFGYPRSLAYDVGRQVLYVADTQYKLIRRYDLATGSVTTLAGRAATSNQGPAPLPPPLANVEAGVPSGLALGPDGSLYYCDRDNHMIRRITATGRIDTIAGTGRAGYLDGPADQAQFSYPSDLSIDLLGNIYVADTHNNRVRRITGTQVTTVVGAGATLAAQNAGLRIGAPTLDLPNAIVVEPGGRGVYIAESNGHRVSRFDLSTGLLTPVAGSGRAGLAGEDGPALEADLALPTALALDADGGLLIADGWALKTGVSDVLGNASRVLRLTNDGRLMRVAGVSNKAYGYSGDGGDPRKAELNNPSGLALDAAGRIFVADTYNNRIRLVRPLPVAPADPTPTPTPLPAAPPTLVPTAAPTATPVPVGGTGGTPVGGPTPAPPETPTATRGATN